MQIYITLSVTHISVVFCKKRLKIPKGQSEKVQKDKQQSTKHAYKTKDRVTRTLLKTGGEHTSLVIPEI